MRLKIDNFTPEDRKTLKSILEDTQASIEFETLNPYQVRRIVMILGQLVQAKAVESLKFKKAKEKE